MVRDQGLDDQIESDEELLNFDLDELSLSEDSVDDPDSDEEIIELVDLVERGSSEEITRDLKVREWAAAGQEAESPRTGRVTPEDAQGAGDEEEGDLDISDLSIAIEMDAPGESEAVAPREDEITEADLDGLLEEDESFTLDFSQDKDLAPEKEEKEEDEITDADLQALLSETGEQELDEEASELESLDVSAEEEQAVELELADETRAPDLEPSAEEGAPELELAEEEESGEMGLADETQAPDFEPPAEESFVAEEPADLLAEEAKGLAAAADEEKDEAALPAEDLFEPAEKEVLPGLEEEASLEETEVFEKETLTGISEERIEEMITSVVKETVERVARETMAEVAERMISEAIETLKQSLEASER